MTVSQDYARARYGGIKPGCAFLGFTSAYGTVVLLSSLAGALAVLFDTRLAPPPGLADVTGLPGDVYGPREQVVGYAVGLAALLVAYYIGGYVAGRMARFDGARQGLGVWFWGLLVSAAIAVLSVSLVDRSLSGLDFFLDLPARIYLGVAVAVAVQLLGAVLGGLAGMRFHRRVDRAAATAPAEG